MLLFIFLLLLCFGIVFYLLRPTKTETAVQQQLEDIKESRTIATGHTILKSEGYSKNAQVGEMVREIPALLDVFQLLLHGSFRLCRP